MMAAITPIRAQLSRFEDVMVSSLNQGNNGGVSGVSGLSAVGLFDEEGSYGGGYAVDDNGQPYTFDDNGLPTPGTSAGGGTAAGGGYTLDDNGLPTYPAGAGSSGGSSGGYQLPGGVRVTYTTPPGGPVVPIRGPGPRQLRSSQLIQGVPNSYLVIGGALLAVVVLMGRR